MLELCRHSIGQSRRECGSGRARGSCAAGLSRQSEGLPQLIRRIVPVGAAFFRPVAAIYGKHDMYVGMALWTVTLTPTDLALAYRQLLEVERGWRDLKGSLGLRPVFHHREDRIRSHVQFCWLGLLLVRVIENATGDSWRNVRHELDRTHLVTMQTAEGRVAQRSNTTPGQAEIFHALDIAEPGRFLGFEIPTPHT
jgi:hypothetical protein